MKSVVKDNIYTIIGSLLIVGVGVLSVYVGYSIVWGDDVDVTASVGETITCSTNVSSSDFGTLTTGSISTASPNATTTVDCNVSSGCTLNIQDSGDGSTAGLANASSSNVIASQTETLSSGSEGYGIQAATSTDGSGAELSLNSTYDKTGDDVGGLTLNNSTLASSSDSVANRKVAVTHKAAISNTTDAGNYSDTITYSCTSN